MGATRSGAVVAGVVCAVLAVACTGAPDDDAEVLGIQVERTGTEVATVTPSASPDDPTADRDEPEPAGEPSPAATGTDADDVPSPAATTDAPAPSTSRPTAPPATTGPRPSPTGPRPSPTGPRPSPTPSPAPTPVALDDREGHSFVTWFRDEEPDGQGGSRYVWAEISATPAVTPEGSEPLRVTLVDLAGEPDRSAPRRAQCRSWLEVDGDRAVHADGDVTVEVVVDDEVVSSGTRHVDVTVPPGERRDLVAIGDVRVAVPDVAEVTCRVRFAGSTTG